MTKTETRLDRLRSIRRDALVTNHTRQAKIEIAYQKQLLKYYQEENASPVLQKIVNDDICEARTALVQTEGRLYVGTIDTGGVWQQQRAYITVNQDTGSVIFNVENMPGGWPLSQVINKKQICFDGGTGWTVKVETEVWDQCREAIIALDQLGALIS